MSKQTLNHQIRRSPELEEEGELSHGDSLKWRLESLRIWTSFLVADRPLFDFFVSIVLGLESSFWMKDLEWRTVVEVLGAVQ